jgi:hypothetical protein
MASSSSSGLPNETNNDFGDESIDGRVAADLDPKEITRLTGSKRQYYETVMNETKDYMEKQMAEKKSRRYQRDTITFKILRDYFNKHILPQRRDQCEEAEDFYESERRGPSATVQDFNIPPGSRDIVLSVKSEDKLTKTYVARWTTHDGQTFSSEKALEKNGVQRSQYKVYPHQISMRIYPNFNGNFYKLICMLEQYIINHECEKLQDDNLLHQLAAQNEYLQAKVLAYQEILKEGEEPVTHTVRDRHAREMSAEEIMENIENQANDYIERGRKAIQENAPIQNLLADTPYGANRDHAGLQDQEQRNDGSAQNPQLLDETTNELTAPVVQPNAEDSSSSSEEEKEEEQELPTFKNGQTLYVNLSGKTRKAKIIKVTDGLVKYKLFDKKEKKLLRTPFNDGVADFNGKIIKE